MKQHNTERLRHNLRAVVDDVEQVLHNMSNATSEQVADLKSRTGKQVHDVRDHLGDMERDTVAQLQRAGRKAQIYVQDHPWQMMGGLAAAAFTVAVLSRMRH